MGVILGRQGPYCRLSTEWNSVPMPTVVACVPSLFALMGTFMSNSSRLWASGDFIVVFVGWHNTRWGYSCVFLGVGF